mmetsp:Transcript_29511/g.81113  ORF Transcript_29511/g.81113 Transcript_29511/m.81113 type:complete len:200 (-) Transcript_29511:1670-2269(-)
MLTLNRHRPRHGGKRDRRAFKWPLCPTPIRDNCTRVSSKWWSIKSRACPTATTMPWKNWSRATVSMLACTPRRWKGRGKKMSIFWRRNSFTRESLTCPVRRMWYRPAPPGRTLMKPNPRRPKTNGDGRLPITSRGRGARNRRPFGRKKIRSLSTCKTRPRFVSFLPSWTTIALDGARRLVRPLPNCRLSFRRRNSPKKN